MAIQILESKPLAGAKAIIRVAADTVADLSEISGVTPVLGSIAIVAEDGKTYMCDSEGEWHEQTGTGGGSSGAGARAFDALLMADATAPGYAVSGGEPDTMEG